jgi:hypothetical protein
MSFVPWYGISATVAASPDGAVPQHDEHGRLVEHKRGGVGFEPTDELPVSGFQDRRLE